MPATGFTNSFTSGEIFGDAEDRTDIQPIEKGCSQATNMLVTVSGPLRKRRGFWLLGSVYDQTRLARLIPFRRSINDALMLEFGDLIAHVWSADGSPLMNLGVQVSFATPYTQAQLAGLRYKQVSDVIYFRHASGLQPQALERLSDISWQFNVETFPNGPWLPENIVDANTVTVTGTALVDGTGSTSPHAGAIVVGQAVTLTASAGIFSAANVGDNFRLRAGTGTAGVLSWTPGVNTPVGSFVLSVGNIYRSIYDAGTGAKANASTPPVQTDGNQSDGCSTFAFLHDGAGVVLITGYSSPTVVTGTVVDTVPLNSGQATSYYAFSAYGNANGWPRAWPSAVEERLVNGAVQGNLDFIDLTRTAGFTPLKEDFHPGLGTGTVVATDALRRRLGDDGAEILWTRQATFLLAGTTSGEYVISGGLFGEPITPSSIICRPVSQFGSADVYPAGVHKGLVYVTRGGETLRKIALDLQQNDSGTDLTFLARHIADRGFDQLAWLPNPDEVLWCRMADGGLTALTMHDEQAVRGWTTQQLPGGFVAEDLVTLPGPGLFETLWLIVSRIKSGVVQRLMLMQSQKTDALFMDIAEEYAGAPATVIGGLTYLVGETVRILADGVQVPDQVVDDTGAITLGTPASRVLVGLAIPVTIRSLKLNLAVPGPGGGLLERARIASCTVDAQAAVFQVGVDHDQPGAQAGPMETVSSRTVGSIGAMSSQRVSKNVTIAGDTSRDPRILITEDSAYDFMLLALKPSGVVRGG